MKNFGVIGASGYIAPRHMNAIKETGNSILCVLDPSDSIGIIDSYFPSANYFSEFERFDRFVNSKKNIDYLTICSPNYLHDSHIMYSLRNGINAICEKPLVLNLWNLDSLIEFENNSDSNISTILQLRLHKSIIDLKRQIENENKIYDVDLTYITSRGKWYDYSWKGDENKSGGILSNIGIHFFDMLHFLFGKSVNMVCHKNDGKTASGFIELENARVRWFLSIDANNLPVWIKNKNQKTYRSIMIDGNEIEFSDGFTDLHTKSYEEILKGNSFTALDAYESIKTVSILRNLKDKSLIEDYHPLNKATTNG